MPNWQQNYIWQRQTQADFSFIKGTFRVPAVNPPIVSGVVGNFSIWLGLMRFAPGTVPLIQPILGHGVQGGGGAANWHIFGFLLTGTGQGVVNSKHRSVQPGAFVQGIASLAAAPNSYACFWNGFPETRVAAIVSNGAMKSAVVAVEHQNPSANCACYPKKGYDCVVSDISVSIGPAFAKPAGAAQWAGGISTPLSTCRQHCSLDINTNPGAKMTFGWN